MFSELSLHERLIKALDELEFKDPTPVQSQAIPAALTQKDLLVSAETGSGKTAAFLLPILHRLMSTDAPKSGTRALILAPTRELVRQIYKHFTQLGAYSHVKASWIIGGEAFKYQRAMFRKNPEIIIATPGRLLEHLEKDSLDLNDLEVLVLDEADRMLDMGLSEEVLKITDRCNKARQTMLFSATLSHRGVRGVAERVLTEPETIIVNTVRDQHGAITQQYLLADDSKHKDAMLVRILGEKKFEKALVFVNTKVEADRLNGYLRYKDIRTGVLHGDLDQDQRNHVMNLMRRGNIDVLVATDVAARGLDVKGIELVINYDMARKGDDYVHRIGRTGRAGEVGIAISMIQPQEWNLKAVIEHYLRVQFEPIQVKGLEGKYKGPKKVKASGKAVGKKKPKTAAEKKALKEKQKGQEKKALKRAARRNDNAQSAQAAAAGEEQPAKRRPLAPVERQRVGFGTIKKRTTAKFVPDEAPGDDD
ncbi:Superfamily II DNA and RNA helicase [Oceanospirillum multiglobuliferum]|uniref:DEAD/DEAH box helicase n=1 Tax=Oceanospirillum multiglobuliferum TaxID=64969 RepID=UPI0009C816A0|nr:DEAD/DEAH box helicase [Oceanospirillum multiglobuliferum]SKA29318.1 Superfamily II DNA and RNA helicase [Oceanospirillum multiglobuliferum]